MIVTVTNTSGHAINYLDSYEGATGGAKKYPLPYPAEWVGSLANSGHVHLCMHPADFRRQAVPGYQVLSPGQEWNQMVQAGQVTFASATETAARDVEELLIIAAV